MLRFNNKYKVLNLAIGNSDFIMNICTWNSGSDIYIYIYIYVKMDVKYGQKNKGFSKFIEGNVLKFEFYF
jgi:hypothetical protein